MNRTRQCIYHAASCWSTLQREDSELYPFLHVHYHHHWAAVVSRGWAKATPCRLQVSLSCAVLCHTVSLQFSSRSSIHRLAVPSLPTSPCFKKLAQCHFCNIFSLLYCLQNHRYINFHAINIFFYLNGSFLDLNKLLFVLNYFHWYKW